MHRDCIANRVVEFERLGSFFRVQVRDVRGLLHPDEMPIAGVVAGVDRQQLVHGRQRAQDLGQVHERNRTECLLEAVGDEVEGVDRSPVGRAEGHQRTRILPSPEHLEKVPGHEPSHGMCDED